MHVLCYLRIPWGPNSTAQCFVKAYNFHENQKLNPPKKKKNLHRQQPLQHQHVVGKEYQCNVK